MCLHQSGNGTQRTRIEQKTNPLELLKIQSMLTSFSVKIYMRRQETKSCALELDAKKKIDSPNASS